MVVKFPKSFKLDLVGIRRCNNAAAVPARALLAGDLRGARDCFRVHSHADSRFVRRRWLGARCSIPREVSGKKPESPRVVHQLGEDSLVSDARVAARAARVVPELHDGGDLSRWDDRLAIRSMQLQLAKRAASRVRVALLPVDRAVWPDLHAFPVGLVPARSELPRDLDRSVVGNPKQPKANSSGDVRDPRCKRLEPALSVLQVHAHVWKRQNPVAVSDVAGTDSAGVPLRDPAAPAASRVAIINRLAVAATLLLEGPWTFFILAPHLTLRRFAAVSQVLLQIGILLTGNYNFFNILTVVMAIAVLDVTNVESSEPKEPEEEGRSARLPPHWITRVDSAWQRFQTNSQATLAMWLVSLVYCVYSVMEIFSITVEKQETSQQHHHYSLEHLLQATTIQFLPTVDDTQAWIARVLPISVNYAALTIVTASMWQLLRFITSQRPKCASKISIFVGVTYLATCTLVNLWIFSSSVLTLSILDRPYQSSLHPFIYSAYSAGEKLHVTSPYGLFRTMTGVRTLERDGKRVSVVARPEIILEGTADNGETWRAYHFKFKPGDVNDSPRLAMPLQPRLDWQMWFAALGDYQGAPWLVHLIHKLLEGSRDVKNLLDTSRDPFPDAPPQMIRAQLYYYDFTRLNTSWSLRIPNADFVASGSGENDPKRWWTRVFAREYMPPLEKGNPSLLSFVRHHYGDGSADTAAPGCSKGGLPGDWMKSELCIVLQALVDSQISPFCLAATLLIAKFASSWTIKTAKSRFRTTAGLPPLSSKLKRE